MEVKSENGRRQGEDGHVLVEDTLRRALAGLGTASSQPQDTEDRQRHHFGGCIHVHAAEDCTATMGSAHQLYSNKRIGGISPPSVIGLWCLGQSAGCVQYMPHSKHGDVPPSTPSRQLLHAIQARYINHVSVVTTKPPRADCPSPIPIHQFHSPSSFACAIYCTLPIMSSCNPYPQQ